MDINDQEQAGVDKENDDSRSDEDSYDEIKLEINKTSKLIVLKKQQDFQLTNKDLTICKSVKTYKQLKNAVYNWG